MFTMISCAPPWREAPSNVWCKVIVALFVLLLSSACTPIEISAAAPSPITLMAQGKQVPASGDPEMVIATLTWVLWLGPTNAEVYLSRAEAYYEQGNYEQALADVNQAFELNPWDPFVFALRSKVYQALEQHEEARKDFERAVSSGTTVFNL